MISTFSAPLLGAKSAIISIIASNAMPLRPIHIPVIGSRNVENGLMTTVRATRDDVGDTVNLGYNDQDHTRKSIAITNVFAAIR